MVAGPRGGPRIEEEAVRGLVRARRVHRSASASPHDLPTRRARKSWASPERQTNANPLPIRRA